MLRKRSTVERLVGMMSAAVRLIRGWVARGTDQYCYPNPAWVLGKGGVSETAVGHSSLRAT